MHELKHLSLFDKVLLWEVLPFIDARCVNSEALKAFFVLNNVLRVELGHAAELLEHVGLRVVYDEVHVQLAKLGQLISFLDQDLLSLAFHFLNTSLLALASSHLFFICKFTILINITKRGMASPLKIDAR